MLSKFTEKLKRELTDSCPDISFDVLVTYIEDQAEAFASLFFSTLLDQDDFPHSEETCNKCEEVESECTCDECEDCGNTFCTCV